MVHRLILYIAYRDLYLFRRWLIYNPERFPMSILVAAYKKNFHEEINRSCSCHPSYDVYERESEFQLLSAKDLESLVDECINFRISDDFSESDKCDLKINYRECKFHLIFEDTVGSANKYGNYDSLECLLLLDDAEFLAYDFELHNSELEPFLDLYKQKWEAWKKAKLAKKQKEAQEAAQELAKKQALEAEQKAEAEKIRKEALFESLKKELGK